MNKILAVSDIHIHDYPHRNPSDKFRLKQYSIIAENIIQVAKEEGANILVIAGDVIEKSIIRPYIQSEVKVFLDKVMSHFEIGYIIWGNHDQDNKGNESRLSDSCLSVMLPSNLHYADGREVTLDGTRIGFTNWRPEIDLSWVKGKLDVLFTHATISYTPSDIFKSQELDETKFDIAFCGDIHRPGQIGKYVSIGIPQRCKMSDGEEITGIVLDCSTKEWKWVDLDPGKKLMKFEYTEDQELEGWHQDDQTWYVYKPSHTGIKDGIVNIQVPAWEEVGQLMEEIVTQAGLLDTHGEVLSTTADLDSKEVDFNFILTRFYCKNWRSIEEAELYFGDGDRILINGKNGSGKSSLLSAIRYAFEENRYLKDFIQFGSKECYAEVEFLYQGNEYKLQRGTKKYGLWVNGEAMKYNNKRDFEEDMIIRFPFITYMDLYFFDSDHNKLLGDITTERKSEIVSKFFKMDRIDALNHQASVLLDQITKETSSWSHKIEEERKVLGYIQSRFNDVVLPSRPRIILEDLKLKAENLQNDWVAWNKYQNDQSLLLTKLNHYKSREEEIQQELSQARDESVINQEIQTVGEEIKVLRDEQAKVGNIQGHYRMAETELSNIKSFGKKAYLELQGLKKGNQCPTCKTVLEDTPEILERKKELEAEVNRLLKEQEQAKSKLAGLEESKNNADQINAELSEAIRAKSNHEVLLRSEINNLNRLKNELSQASSNKTRVQTELDQTTPVPEVTLPDGFMTYLSDINSELSVWDLYDSLERDKEKSENVIIEAEQRLEAWSGKIESLTSYINITGPTGKVYEEIMTKLASQFSDNQVKYEVLTYKFRGKDFLDLAPFFNNGGNWVGYQACSSGQRTILDINFLSKVVTRTGLLIMDEFLKHLDPAAHEVCIDAILGMNVGCTLLSSHMESLPAFNNKTCNLELNENSSTVISLK